MSMLRRGPPDPGPAGREGAALPRRPQGHAPRPRRRARARLARRPCARGLEEVAREYGADEAIVVTITHDHAARRRSYELIAEAFGLERAPARALRRVKRLPALDGLRGAAAMLIAVYHVWLLSGQPRLGFPAAARLPLERLPRGVAVLRAERVPAVPADGAARRGLRVGAVLRAAARRAGRPGVLPRFGDRAARVPAADRPRVRRRTSPPARSSPTCSSSRTRSG